MSLIDAIIIGLVQGITEFLPISSSGHLVIFQNLLNINLPGNLIEVAAHFGTLLSIILIYWKDILKQINYVSQHLMVVRFFRVNSKIVTSKFWFSHGSISKILV